MGEARTSEANRGVGVLRVAGVLLPRVWRPIYSSA
jgi:hypothetical protein